MAARVWVLFDERACDGTDRSAELDRVHSLRDLKKAIRRWYFSDAWIFEYEEIDGQLHGERRIGCVTEKIRTLLDRCTIGA